MAGAQDAYLKTYKYRHNDWSGGQNDEIRATLLNNNQSQILYDVSLDQKGTLYPCSGHSPRYAVTYGPVDGIGYYERADGKQYLLVAIGSNLYYDDLSVSPPSLVLISNNFIASDFWDFTMFNNLVYITNGIDYLHSWDGTTLTDVSGAPYSFTHLEVHNNMLWGVEAGTSRVRWSKILDGNTWDALNFIDFNPMNGDPIRRIIRFQSYLAVAKRKQKAILTGSTTSNYAQTWLEGFGTVGQNAMGVAEKYIAYVGSDGIRLTDLVNDILISQQLNKSWRTRVNKSCLDKAALIHWRNYILVALPVDGAIYNNEVWCYDLRYNSWVILRNLTITCWTLAYANGEEVLYGGDYTYGQVIRMFDYSYKYYPGAANEQVPVEYDWFSKEWTFNEPERYKLFKNIYLEMEGVEELSRVNMWLYIDDTEFEVATEAVEVPFGEGVYRHVRIIPPIYGAVLGRKLSVRVKGRVPIRGLVVEYSPRSNIPPGGVI